MVIAESAPLLNDRQRRTVMLGTWVVAAAVMLTYVIVPFVREWRVRESRIATMRAKVERLTQVVGTEGAVDSLVRAREAALALEPTRVQRARSRALAASALQSLVQELADASNVSVTRLDVAAFDAGMAGGASANAMPRAMLSPRTARDTGDARDAQHAIDSLPMTLSANGDIYGLTALLEQLRRARQALVVDKLSVQVNSALRGAPDVLQMTVTLHAPVIVE